MSTAPLRITVALLLGAGLWVCSCGTDDTSQYREPLGVAQSAYKIPTTAFCEAQVTGTGTVDTETDYIPHVVNCENGGADLQALKAQAIAARSALYYSLTKSGSICDGQSCQVYSCSKTPAAKHIQAAKETTGQILSWHGILTYGFYVNGDPDTAPPSCVGSPSAANEHWITYNEGKSGFDVTQTKLGWVFETTDKDYGQNRGCMGQWGGRCLEKNKGYDYKKILQFYYGADIEIVTIPGPCVVPQDAGSGGSGGGGTGGASQDAAPETSSKGGSGGAGGSGASGGSGGSGGTSTGGQGGTGQGGNPSKGGATGQDAESDSSASAPEGGDASGSHTVPVTPNAGSGDATNCNCSLPGTRTSPYSALLALGIVLAANSLRRRRS